MTTPPTLQPQPAPLHPLLLLADYIEAYRAQSAGEAALRNGEPVNLNALIGAQHRAEDAILHLDPAALRAQAAEALAALETEVVRPHADATRLYSCLCCGGRGVVFRDRVQHQAHCPVVTLRDALADADARRDRLERMQTLAREARDEQGTCDGTRAALDQLVEMARGAV